MTTTVHPATDADLAAVARLVAAVHGSAGSGIEVVGDTWTAVRC